MKSQISPKPIEQVKYPCLMKAKSSGNIVLFVGVGCGYIVNADPRTEAKFWDYSHSWDHREFELYSGDVILSND